MKYKTTFIDSLYVLKVGNNMYYFKILKKSMLILNMFIYKLFYWKKNSSRHYCCSNVKNSEDSNGFSIKLLGTHTHTHIFKWIHVYILEKYLRMKVFIPFGQSMKKTIMVKVGYYCMKQMMMWDNVVMFPFH